MKPKRGEKIDAFTTVGPSKYNYSNLENWAFTLLTVIALYTYPNNNYSFKRFDTYSFFNYYKLI